MRSVYLICPLFLVGGILELKKEGLNGTGRDAMVY